MAKEAPVVEQADAERVRKKIAVVGEEALELISQELVFFGKQKGIRGKVEFIPLSEEWVKNYKWIADQLRRDYRLDGAYALPADRDSEPDADPLAGLRLVSPEEAG